MKIQLGYFGLGYAFIIILIIKLDSFQTLRRIKDKQTIHTDNLSSNTTFVHTNNSRTTSSKEILATNNRHETTNSTLSNNSSTKEASNTDLNDNTYNNKNSTTETITLKSVVNDTKNHTDNTTIDTTKDSINKNLLNITNNSSNVTADALLTVISNQTENIKKEICSNCKGLLSALDDIISSIKVLKGRMKFTINNNLTKKEYTRIVLNVINKVNLIKVDLHKLNEALSSLQKARCDNFANLSKKHGLVKNSTDKLVEVVQEVIKHRQIKINLVFLN